MGRFFPRLAVSLTRLAECAIEAEVPPVPGAFERDTETSADRQPLNPVWKADGQRKYPRSKLLLSSADRGWMTLSAELWSHPTGRIVSIEQQNVEVVIALAATDGSVTPIGAGREEHTHPDPGMV